MDATETPLYRLELEAFAQAIADNNPSLIRSTYKDSIASLKTTLKVVDALEVNQRVKEI